MTTILLIILFVIIAIVVNFFYNLINESNSVTKQGGMLEKYKLLIKLLGESFPEMRIVDTSSVSVSIEAGNRDGFTKVTLTQSFGNLTVQWSAQSKFFDNHKLEWNFDQFLDQNEIFDKFIHDIIEYNRNVARNKGFNLRNQFDSVEVMDHLQEEEIEVMIPDKPSYMYVDNGDYEMIDWNDILKDDSETEEFKKQVQLCMMRFRINFDKYYSNKVYLLGKKVIPENEHEITPSARLLKNDREVENSELPGWFLWAFPDVVYWLIKGEGKSFLLKDDSIEQDKVKLLFGFSRTIEFYLKDNTLECSIHHEK